MKPQEFLFYFIFQYGLKSLMELYFYTHYINYKNKIPVHCYTTYTIFIYIMIFLEVKFQSSPISFLFLLINTIFLMVMGITYLKQSFTLSLLAAILTKTIIQLSDAVTRSVSFLLPPKVLAPSVFIFFINYSFVILSILLTFLCYRLILKKFLVQIALPNNYLITMLVPVYLIILIDQFISNQVYGNEVVIENSIIVKPNANHWQMLWLELFSFLSLFSILYACKKLSESLSSKIKFTALEQQLYAEKIYIKEAQSRYEQTRSFRHDIRNHFLILNGLLEQDKLEAAKKYLKKMDRISESLTPICSTGNNVVDILLNNKLTLAKEIGIHIECTIKFPFPFPIDDLDLCILFSNALDNALKACNNGLKQEIHPYIHLTGRQKGNFYMIEMENSIIPLLEYKKGSGIGLRNIQYVAEKYHGAITTEKEKDYYRLSVLLIIPGDLNNISGNIY